MPIRNFIFPYAGIAARVSFHRDWRSQVQRIHVRQTDRGLIIIVSLYRTAMDRPLRFGSHGINPRANDSAGSIRLPEKGMESLIHEALLFSRMIYHLAMHNHMRAADRIAADRA